MNKKLIRGGWESYRNLVVPKSAGDTQIAETKQAFYAGASVLFHAIMNVLDPGEEPTEKDLDVLSNIQKEIDFYGQSLDRKILGINRH